MRWLCLVRRGLVSTYELVEVITTELIQGLVQPHHKWLPRRGFLRAREIRLFRFVRFFRITILTLASAGMLRQALPHGRRTYGKERNGRTGLSIERAWVELGCRGLDRQGQQGGDQGQRRVAQGLQAGDHGHAACLPPELESQERGGLATLGGSINFDLASGETRKRQRRRV